MNGGTGSPRPDAFAREIEREWSRLLDRPVVLSPKDWALISDWHAREIPLALIVESMRHAAERPSGRSAPRNLGYIAAAVEEAWQVVLDGRLAHPPAPPRRPPVADPVEAWRRCIASEDPESALRRLLSESLEAFEAGETAGAIDLRVNDELDASVSGELRAAIHDQVDAELAPFAERMDGPTLEKTRRAAIVDRLRRVLELPLLDPLRQGPRDRPC